MTSQAERAGRETGRPWPEWGAEDVDPREAGVRARLGEGRRRVGRRVYAQSPY